MPRRLIAGAVLALLWLACGWVPFFLQQIGGSAATLARMVPSPMRGGFFGSPVGWSIALHALALVLVAAGYAAIASLLARRGEVSFTAGWLAAVLTGFALGAVLDLGDVVAWWSRLGVAGALGTTGAASLTVFWALLVGWIPALVVARDGPRDATDSAMRRGPIRSGLAAVGAVAVVAALALPFAAEGAHAATQAQLRQDQAAAQADAAADADPDGAAPRDPGAAGEPVPTAAPSTTPIPADACTAENSTLMAPAADAATGHRLQPLQLFNSSEEPCTVSEYPDVAFGDQNGHLLPVTIERGSSFMATDAGPSAITVAPGSSVRAGIGWDANSVHGQLAARTLWMSPLPGAQRLSWDVSLDIIPGTVVHVTAWEANARVG